MVHQKIKCILDVRRHGKAKLRKRNIKTKQNLIYQIFVFLLLLNRDQTGKEHFIEALGFVQSTQ